MPTTRYSRSTDTTINWPVGLGGSAGPVTARWRTFAPNASGKSALLDALAFCLFDVSTRATRANNIINKAKINLHCKLNFEIDGVDYFIEKRLYPNVDFYSGIILKAIGFPTTMFTVLFAIGRTVGWVSQWKEMIEDPINKIGRPRQLYIGEESREYEALEKREKKSIFKWLWQRK